MKINSFVELTFPKIPDLIVRGKVTYKSITYVKIEWNGQNAHIKYARDGGKRYYVRYLRDDEIMLMKLEQ